MPIITTPMRRSGKMKAYRWEANSTKDHISLYYGEGVVAYIWCDAGCPDLGWFAWAIDARDLGEPFAKGLESVGEAKLWVTDSIRERAMAKVRALAEL
jgi:hypothetical protein